MDEAQGRRLLEEIMRRMSPDEPTPESAAVLAAMSEVARLYPRQMLSVEPVATELVSAALRACGSPLAEGSDARQMCLWIANSICGNPETRRSLESLWSRLRENCDCV
jgi:hypothetical protein